jgi:diaminohydroxyphosphoribosylaminopyrimidine deaminase/5-amino-6-(5-phosphoribosylamino)uracil reductase
VNDETFMAHALRQARLVSPTNPCRQGIACVQAQRLVAYTTSTSCKENSWLTSLVLSPDVPPEATLYLVLEPLLLDFPPFLREKIQRVVCSLPFPENTFHRRCLQYWQEQKIEYRYHVLEKEAFLLNAVFLKNTLEQRPFIRAKWAMTWDGKIATRTGASQWISSLSSREYVHHLRGQSQGILVGIGTVLADDPLLTCRYGGGQNPQRLIVDRHLRLPLTSKIAQSALEVETHIFYESASPVLEKALEEKGIHLHSFRELTLQSVFEKVFQWGILSVFIEGGATLFASAFEQGLVDELYLFLGPKLFGGVRAKSPIGGEGVGEVKEAWELFEMEVVERPDGDLWLKGQLGFYKRYFKKVG